MEYTPTVAKVLKNSWFVVPISTLLPTENAKSLASLFRGKSEISRDRDKLSEIVDGTIPFSNCSQSSWFVPISTLVPTENAKSLASLFMGDSEI